MSCCNAKARLIEVELLYAKLIQADLGQDFHLEVPTHYVVYNDVSR